MGGSSSGLSSLDTRTTLGAAAPRRAAVRALRTGAGPLRRRSARFPRPRNRCVRLDHWVDTARPAPGKRNTGRSKYARPTAGRFTQAHFGPPPRRAAWMGRDSDGFWTAPPARCFTQLWKRRSHPRGSVALQAHGSVALSAHAPDRIGAGNHLLSRQPPGSSRASPGRNHRVRGTLYPESPGSSRASPGHNHPLGQATTYWGRKIAYPNTQFPTQFAGDEDLAEAICLPQCTVSYPNARARGGRGPVAYLEVRNASEFQARTGAGRAHGPKCV